MKKILLFINSGSTGRSKQFSVLTLLAVLLFCCVQQSTATSYTWTGSVSNSLVNKNNWLPVGVPGSGDTCTINFLGTAGGAYTINLSSGSTMSIGLLTINLSAPSGAV